MCVSLDVYSPAGGFQQSITLSVTKRRENGSGLKRRGLFLKAKSNFLHVLTWSVGLPNCFGLKIVPSSKKNWVAASKQMQLTDVNQQFRMTESESGGLRLDPFC